MESEYELVSDAILGTNLQLHEEYITIYIRWLWVGVDIMAVIVSPSTLVVSCTATDILIIVIVYSTKLYPIMWIALCKPISISSSKPSFFW